MNRLRELRLQHGKTQQDIATYLNLTPKAISFYEKGERDIPNATLQKLADYFHVSTDEILGRDTAEYYLDKETARLANEMKENPGRRVLFDATRNLSPEKIKQVKDFVDFITRDQEFSE